MKRIHLFLLICFSFCLFSCQKTEAQPTLIGTWKDTGRYYQYPNATDTIIYDNCLYTFHADNTFFTENEYPLGIKDSGVWSYLNPPTVYLSVDNAVIGTRTHEWEILSHTEDELEVLFHANHFAVGGASGAFTSKRHFKRVQ